MTNRAHIFARLLRSLTEPVMSRTIHEGYAFSHPELVGPTLKATQDILYFAKRDYNKEHGEKIAGGAKGYFWIRTEAELKEAKEAAHAEAITAHGKEKRIRIEAAKRGQMMLFEN